MELGTYLAHPAKSWQAWSVEAPLVGGGQHDEHLRDVSIAKTRILAGKVVTSVGQLSTSISLVFRSLTMSLSNIKSLLPLSVKTTTRDFGDAFCRATSRPWANMMMISQLIPDTGYKYSRARSRP